MAFKDRFYDVPVLGTALRVQDRYKEDAGNQFAAAMGFFGFLSLFPILLLALSVLGYVLHDDPARQTELIDRVQGAIPGFGAAAGEQTAISEAIRNIADNPGAIGLIGLVTLLLAGLRVVDSAMAATERVFRVQVEASAIKRKLRQLGALAGLGALVLVGTVAASSVGPLVQRLPGTLSVAAFVLAPLVAVGLDLVLFLVAYRVLASGSGPAYRELLPGALLAAVGWTALKIFGATYVSNQVSRANELYGTLGGVIGLLLLLFLAGRLYLYGAELSAVLRRPGEDLAAGDEHIRRHGPVAPGAEGAPTAREQRSRDRSNVELQDDQARGEPVEDPTDELDRAAARAPEHRAATLPPPEGGAPPTGEQRSPAVGAATRERLAEADRRNARSRDPHYVRGALAFVIAVGTAGGLVYASGVIPDD